MRRLFLVQHGLIDFHSHFYGEAKGWAAACKAREVTPLFYVNRHAEPRIVKEFQAKAVFPFAPDADIEPDGACAVLSDYIFLAEAFARNLQALQADKVGGDDAVVVTFATARDLYGAAIWLGRLAPQARPRMVFIFHAPSFHWSIDEALTTLSGDYSWHRHAAKRLRAALPPEKLVLLATNLRLAKAISFATELACGVAPLAAHYVSDAVLAGGDESEAPHVHVRLAGEFREEKGSGVALGIIKRFTAARPGLPFGVQVSSQTGAQWLAEQVADCPSQVFIHYGDATHEDYQRRLARSDLVLLPYRWDRYALRASGVFTEALAFGLVTVVPQRTWMSDKLAQGWGAGATFSRFSAAAITRALVVASEALPKLRAAATATREAWRREQSAEALLDLVLQRLSMTRPTADTPVGG